MFQGEAHDQSLRAMHDLEIRRQVFSAARIIKVPENYDRDFWHWYAAFIRCGREYSLEVDDTWESAEYPQPQRDVAIWYSGGVESTYTLYKIGHLKPELLSIDDYAVFSGPHRRVGPIHFICAAVSAQLGFRRIYLGVERNDPLLCRTAHARSFVERTPLFLERWNDYRTQNQLLSECSHLHKEEIISELHDCGIPITGTCDNMKNGWCGRCFKCFEAFYSAKVNDIDLGVRLKEEAFDQFYGEYQRYIASGFKENPYNALQYFVRLQMFYGLEFERDRDCE